MMRSTLPSKFKAWRLEVKFLIDENVNDGVEGPLTSIFFNHQFVTVHGQGWAGVADDSLFGRMAENGFDALITRDKAQLTDPNERNGLRDRGLHWIGVTSPKFSGLKGLSLETAAVIAALPYVLDDLITSPAPTAFHIRGVPTEHDQRVKSELI